ncbi:hypothetical protein TRFO_21952 [Tritrichomonas foetus]|uniref:Katanin p80 subunit C-terminal domain-containing protein n=1 Tax=Tritrichomonas foetus TaxID=1144522 RepID=A0A1J4KDZ5_9EUKA|nr:hypothetical protein TRFO_21952 [Tritrichomonas foetus]|eukprot:OHT09218.1 hypothetical protein TRFO_21952 [Tritrichomonas foetus]
MPPKLQRLQNVIAHEGIVNCVSLGHKTSQVFATGGDDRFLFLWLVGNNNPRSTFGPFQSSITSTRFSDDEEKIICGNNGGTVMYFDVNENRCISNWAAHRSRVNCLLFHPTDEKVVISCGYDGKIKLLAKNKRKPIHTFNAHDSPVNSISISSDGRYIASGSSDKTVKIFDITSQRQIAKFTGHTDSVTSVSFHPTEPVLISCSVDRSIRFFDLESMSAIPVSFPLDSSPVDLVTFVPGENIALSGSADYLKIVGWKPPEFFDHFTLGLEKVHDISIVDRTATIASTANDRALIHKIKLDQMNPFSSMPSKPTTPRLLNLDAIKNIPQNSRPTSKLPSQPSSQVTSQPQSQTPSMPNSSKKVKRLLRSAENDKNDVVNENENKESRVFKDFRRSRSSYMSTMNEKYSRLTRIKDSIKQRGLTRTLQDCAQSGDLGVEILMIMRMKPNAIKLEHSALLMQIAVRVFDRDFDIAVTTVEAMLQAFGKLVNATRQISSNGVGHDVALEERKKKCQLFIESFREIAPKLRTIAVGKSMTSQAAAEILDEWKIFLR